MYRVEFSLNKWNFIVNFNDYKDYLFYKKQIETSVDCMHLKNNGVDPIVINYVNDKSYFNSLMGSLSGKERIKTQSFENEYYDKVDDYFISSKDRYILNNSGNKKFELVCNGNLERHELIYLIREVYVRLEENNKSLFMHGNGIVYNDKGIIFTGNSGSGKTTLMIKLLENNPNCMKFLSNDRIFMTQDGRMEYFPIPIILANGSCKNNEQIRSFLEKCGPLYDSEFDKGMLLDESDNIKFALFRNYIPEVYSNCSLGESHKLDAIIIPRIDFDTSDITLTQVTDNQEVHHMCFTPFDYESLRKPWIMQRDLNEVELFDVSLKLIGKKIEEGKVFKLRYNPNFSPKMIQEEVEKKLIKHL